MPILLVVMLPDGDAAFQALTKRLPGESTWSSARIDDALMPSTRFLEHAYGKPAVMSAIEGWKDTHRAG